jgi:DHA3 family tetracycline resistance protein-like MFS transporter
VPRPTLDAPRVYLTYQLTFSFAFTLAATVNLVWQVEAGLGPLQLVLIGSILEATAFLMEIPTGVLADTYSRRLSVIVGLLLYGLGWTLEGAIGAFWAFAASQVLWGTGATFISGANDAWIADEVGEARVGALYVRGAQMAQLGAFVAIPIAALLATVRLNLPVLLGGLLFFAIALFLILCMPERGFHPAPRERRGTFGQMAATFAGGVGVVRGQPALATILLIGAFFGMASEGVDRLGTPHFLALGLPTLGSLDPVVWFGVMGMGSALLALLATRWLAPRVDTAHHRAVSRWLLGLTALQVLATAAFALAPAFAPALAASWALGVVRRLIGPLYSAWLNQGLDPRYRATVLSMRGQVDAFGQIAGGPLLGLVGTWLSLRHALVAAGFILLPALPLFSRARGQARTPPQARTGTADAAGAGTRTGIDPRS